MTDAAFVAAGWIGTAAAISVYAGVLAVRLRRADRTRTARSTR